jgi:hypothetical protein
MLNEKVSGVGANASRTDKNLSARVQKVVNDAKIQNATGGAYADRSKLTNLAEGASTEVSTALPTAPVQPDIQNQGIPVKTTNVFAPGTPGVPLSHGAKGGPGADSSILQTPVDAVDQSSVLARALLQSNPTSRQLAMMVEAFNEMDA